MKTLIIGSKGTLGGEFVRQLGPEAIGWDFEDIDITKKEEMKKIVDLKPDLIINCAAYNAVDQAETDREAAMNINAHAVGYLAETAKELNTKIVHYSTDFVFDGTNPDGYKEDDKPNPQSVYAESKYLGEKLLQEKTDKFYIIRLCALFGRSGGGSFSKKNFIDKRIEDAKAGKEITMVSDEYASPTYAPDLVRRTLYILDNNLPFGIYHGTNYGFCSWYDFTKKIFEIAKIDAMVTPVSGDKLNRPAKRPKQARLLNTKLPQARNYEDALYEYIYGSEHNNS